jgi:hypothetical protein
MSFLLVVMMAALVSAHFVTVQKNSRQSNFFSHLGDLRAYGASGVYFALHEMSYKVGKGDGLIGTELWTTSCDFGRDGVSGTKDEGEGDGIPTPGEPNLAAVAVGPTPLSTKLLVRSSDTIWADVLRVVSTAYDATAMVAEEVYALRQYHTIPPVGTIYVEGGTNVDVNGNSFAVGGTDTNPDGTKVTGAPTVWGIATDVGSPAGSNTTDITSGIPSARLDQITGTGGSSSVSETNLIDFDTIWGWFSNTPKTTVAPADYTTGGGTWGTAATNDYRVTYCKGDLELSGGFKGAGVLLVDGSVTFSGHSEWAGVVLVKGDCILTGGGYGVHIFGSLLQAKSDTNQDPTLTISGNTTVLFSSLALSNATKLIPPDFKIIYWNDLK